MRREKQFDEVMIVNPDQSSPSSNQRVRLMRFHNVMTPEVAGFAESEPYGYYAEPAEYGYYSEVDPALGYYAEVEPAYGYYSEPDPALGYYAEAEPAYGYYSEPDPPLGYYAEADPAFGYYGEADPPLGYYSEAEPAYGYYAQAQEFPGVGAYNGCDEYRTAGTEPVGYYAEENPVGYYGEDPNQSMGYYGQTPEMVGYGEADPQFAEDYPGVSFYGEQDFAEPEFAGYSGYTRDTPPSFNAGCPLPTNLSGYDDVDGYDGYTSPATVNPTCDTMTPQPGTSPSVPDTFKPLW
jgi:hypothetical protein